MSYKVIIKRKILNEIRKLPVHVQKRMKFLVDDLKEKGPIAHNWPNYSKLSATEYH
jgi:mRNA-degrading endonuclease RelE of RelBE toxin-antitoxin system